MIRSLFRKILSDRFLDIVVPFIVVVVTLPAGIAILGSILQLIGIVKTNANQVLTSAFMTTVFLWMYFIAVVTIPMLLYLFFESVKLRIAKKDYGFSPRFAFSILIAYGGGMITLVYYTYPYSMYCALRFLDGMARISYFF